MYKRSGFTLLELLIVCSLIGILATVVGISLVNLRQKARNTARREDVSAYQVALDQWRVNRNQRDYRIYSDYNQTPALVLAGADATGFGKLTRRGAGQKNSIADVLQQAGVLNKVRPDPLALNQSYELLDLPDYYLTLCAVDGTFLSDQDLVKASKAADFAIFSQLEGDTASLAQAATYCGGAVLAPQDGTNYSYARGSKSY